MQGFTPEEAEAFSRDGQQLFHRIETLSKVVIAVVNGFCLGGGNELAMACDIRLASVVAKFGQPEANLGVIPGFGGTYRLQKYVGAGKARELILTGEVISAEEACKIGLVQCVYPPEELWERALSIARKIAAKGPAAVKTIKHIMTRNWGMPVEEAIVLEAKGFRACVESGEAKGGMEAFLAKKEPDWAKGR
jgi:enoyl-CoA hydratase